MPSKRPRAWAFPTGAHAATADGEEALMNATERLQEIEAIKRLKYRYMLSLIHI